MFNEASQTNGGVCSLESFLPVNMCCLICSQEDTQLLAAAYKPQGKEEKPFCEPQNTFLAERTLFFTLIEFAAPK